MLAFHHAVLTNSDEMRGNPLNGVRIGIPCANVPDFAVGKNEFTDTPVRHWHSSPHNRSDRAGSHRLQELTSVLVHGSTNSSAALEIFANCPLIVSFCLSVHCRTIRSPSPVDCFCFLKSRRWAMNALKSSLAHLNMLAAPLDGASDSATPLTEWFS